MEHAVLESDVQRNLIAEIASDGLPQIEPDVKTRTVSSKWPGVTGDPVDWHAAPGFEGPLKPRDIVVSVDWKPHLDLLKIIHKVGDKLGAELGPGKMRPEIDKDQVFGCITKLMDGAFSTRQAINEAADNKQYYYSGRKRMREIQFRAAKERNDAILGVLKEVSFKITPNDFDQIIEKVFNSNPTLETMGVVVRMSRWAGTPLNPENSAKFLDFIEKEKGQGLKTTEKFIRKAIGEVTPLLSRNH